MKLFKKATVLMLAVALPLGVFQVSAFADGEPKVIEGFGIMFDEPHEGDLENPEVSVDMEGVEVESISFLTKERN